MRPPPRKPKKLKARTFTGPRKTLIRNWLIAHGYSPSLVAGLNWSNVEEYAAVLCSLHPRDRQGTPLRREDLD